MLQLIIMTINLVSELLDPATTYFSPEEFVRENPYRGMYGFFARHMAQAANQLYARMDYRDNFLYNVERHRYFICEVAPAVIRYSLAGAALGALTIYGSYQLTQQNPREEESLPLKVARVFSMGLGFLFLGGSLLSMNRIAEQLSNYRYPL